MYLNGAIIERLFDEIVAFAEVEKFLDTPVKQPASMSSCTSCRACRCGLGSYTISASLFDQEDLVDVWYGVPDLLVATQHLAYPDDYWGGILNIPCELQLNQLHHAAENAVL